jgi:hypothetical protein
MGVFSLIVVAVAFPAGGIFYPRLQPVACVGARESFAESHPLPARSPAGDGRRSIGIFCP